MLLCLVILLQLYIYHVKFDIDWQDLANAQLDLCIFMLVDINGSLHQERTLY